MKWLRDEGKKAFMFAVIIVLCLWGARAEAEGFQKIWENEGFLLYADKTSGAFWVEDKETGDKWYSSPREWEQDGIANELLKKDMASSLIVKYIDIEARNESSVNSCVGSVNLDSGEFLEIEGGFAMEYTFPGKGGKVRVEIRLKEGYLEVTVPVDEILETAPNLLYSISLLPYFGAGSAEEEGYLFVPDGCGALIYFNNGKQTYDDYRQTIYGGDFSRDELVRGSLQQDVRLPVFGAQNGKRGFLAVVTQGDALASVNARVSGAKTSYNNIYCEFALRTSGVKNLGNGNLVTIYEDKITKTQNLTIRYYLLSGGECDYSAMAAVYRDYLIEEMGMESFSPSEEMPFYLELYGAVRRSENILGIPVTVTTPLTDYESALSLLERLETEGVGGIVFKYTNANRDNVKGTRLSEFRPVAKLGTRKQLEELVAYCDEKGIVFAPNGDLITFWKSAFPGTDKYVYGSRGITGAVASRYGYRLSTDRIDDTEQERYLTAPLKLGEEAEGFVNSLLQYNLKNISLDTMSSSLYSDYYGERVGRQESLCCMRDVVKRISENMENVILSDANAYLLPYARYIEDAPWQSSRFNVTDQDIPFYQMAVSGLVSYAVPAVNLQADPGLALLRAIESGSCLKYTWITGDPADLINTEYMELYGTDSSAWMESALENYRIVNAIYQKSEGSRILEHNILAEGVRETKFENGVSVIVNYNDAEALVRGQYKVSPRSWMIIE